ncbi:hypothetical protein ACR788_21670 [Sphingobacterium siyangense]|uniref:hypothetical protein n=1 Tax=Sphingobacterium siyangense TaxID=459529 RepID=UPI003DA39C58
MDSLEVKLITKDSNSINRTLGISDERHIELCDAIKELVVVKQEQDISVMLCELSKVCQHPNELAYISFKLSHVLHKQQELQQNPFAMLMQMMGGRG